ncbi:DUF6461 domain-containing protein [Actinokineospora terrae]|uniref:Uncharacterized protein n=1 Tax=Actinokineospora terrae TaxID=155974 RepID=A0A1H9T5V9_9PSEU|nr:DUF6461 domain-containing protein [Actinokineospora terrae]SER92561.1 hypothetical protein SAMN04487818_10685 [Actinokineospora terrae]
MRAVTRYAWADTAFDLAWTLAVTTGRTEYEVLAAYGVGGDAQPTDVTFEAALAEHNEHVDDYGLLQLTRHDECVLAIEPNGWVGNAPAVARQLASPSGLFVSVYWSANGDHQIVQARDGQLVGRFDPTFIGLPAGANDMLPGWVEPEDFPLDHLKSASLAAVERVTAVAFEESWLTTPLPTYRLPA